MGLLFKLFLSLLVLSLASDEVRFVLKLQNLGQFEDMFWRISNNGDRFLTPEEITKVISPKPEQLKPLIEWLHSHHARPIISKTRDYVSAHLSSALAKQVVDEFHSKKPQILSSAIHKMLDGIYVKNALKAPHKKPEKLNKRASLQGTLADPNTQKVTYQVLPSLIATNASNSQVVWGPGTYGSSLDDLSIFFSTYNLPGSTSDVSYPGFPGTPGGDNWGEGTLDTQYITAFAPGAKTIVWNSNTSSSTEEGNGFGYAFLDWLFMLGQMTNTELPLVMSLSLGSLSIDSCTNLCMYVAQTGNYTLAECNDYMNQQRQVCMYDTVDQVERMNVEFMKLGSRGMTILAATGDGGSHWSFQPFNNQGIGAALNVFGCKYNWPTFPASSPYVTAVGGLSYNGGTLAAPVTWPDSGGGFSWRFKQPPYQAKVVQAYLNANSGTAGFPSKGSFPPQGRAYPDLSGLADETPMVIGGQVQVAGGTSASTPTVAGLVTLINDVRLNKGLRSLGFLNPKLYEIAAAHPGEAFFDVTVGNTGTNCAEGFPAAAGWDPDTGLGSPLFPGLLKYLATDSH